MKRTSYPWKVERTAVCVGDNDERGITTPEDASSINSAHTVRKLIDDAQTSKENTPDGQ